MNENRFRNGSNGSGSTPSEAWLFAQELLGRPVPAQPEAPAETLAERRVRGFVESITDHSRSRPPVTPALVSKPVHLPPRPTETSSQRELREWVESISNATESGSWDSSKHPRGGFPENPGWFSPSSGGGGGGASSRSGGREHRSSTRAPLRSWPEPVNRDEFDQTRSTRGRDRARGGGQLAFQPPQSGESEPKIKRADDLGKQAPQQAAKVVGIKPFPNDFGDFHGQPKGESEGQLWITVANKPEPNATPDQQQKANRVTQDALAQSARLQDHIKSRIPEGVRESLKKEKKKVKVVITPTLADAKQKPDPSTGGLYNSQQGTIYLPRNMANGTPNPHPERNLRHEFGHAFDHSINGSTSPEFRDAYWDDLKAAGVDLRDLQLDHYVPGGVGKPMTARERWEDTGGPFDPRKTDAEREAFAEAFAAATQGKKDDGQPNDDADRAKSFRETFPRTIAHVERKIREKEEEYRRARR